MAKIFLALLSLYLVPGWAAVPGNSLRIAPQKKIYDILMQPHKKRLLSLKANAESFDQLEKMAKDQRQTLQVRWRAITAMGEVFPKKSKNVLESLATSREWYVRNAVMIALNHVDRATALKWARYMLEDRSLIVRTSAVQTIRKFKATELRDLLWKKIDSEENFHRGQSLWIRKDMAATLMGFAGQGEEEKFLRLLLDGDPRIHPFAMAALKKITGENPGKGKTVADARSSWIKYFKNRFN